MRNYIIMALCTVFTLSSLHSQKDAAHNSAPKETIYKIIDGDSLRLQFFYPKTFDKSKQYPAMVFFFGGGWTGGSMSQFENQAMYFAARGIVTAVADYRVKSRNGTSPFEAVKDAKSAIRYVRAHANGFGIDPDKIIGAGGSAGGHLAAVAGIIDGLEEKGEDLSVSSKPNALVLFNPVIDQSPKGYGYDKVGKRYLEISPLQNIKKEAPPTILFLGTKDKLIAVATVKEFKRKMEAVGSRCELHLYEGGAHGFFNKGRQEGDKYYIETVRDADFFLQSLGYLSQKDTLEIK